MRSTSRTLALTAVLTLLLLAACTAADEEQAEGPVEVVVTINILGDLAERTFGPHAEVTTLMPPGADPHGFEISAAEAEGLERADLLVSLGLGMEEQVGPIVEAAAEQGTPLLEVGEHLDPLPYGPEAIEEDPERPDPHVFTDPRRMVAVPELLAEALLDAVGEQRVDTAALRERVAEHTDELRALDADVEQTLAVVPPEDRVLVTNHHVFGYFAERYDFEVLGAVVPGGTTLASPSPADLADLAAVIEEAGVPAIFADSSAPTLLSEALAEEVDIEVEVVSLWTESLAGPGSGAETYDEMMRTNADTIADVLVDD